MSPDIRPATTTRAVLSVRIEADETLRPASAREPMRSALNLKQLIQIIRHGQIQDESEEYDHRPVKYGRKRTAPVATSSRKRAKAKATSPPSVLHQATSDAIIEGELVHVYSHNFEIGYTLDPENGVASNNRNYVNDERAEQVGWLSEEKELINTLSDRSGDSSDPHTFELGDITIGDHWGVIKIFHASLPKPVDDELYFLRHLLTLPSAPGDGALTSRVLNTCRELQRGGRASMTASANLIFIPGTPAPDLPIQINIKISVSLIIPAIFSPPAFHAAPASSSEDKRRRFLSYLFCPHPSQINGSSQEQENAEGTSIRHFYSILRPAPPNSSPLMDDTLQPEGLDAMLLPFQKRTVNWLLEREGKTISTTGQVVPQFGDPETLPLFWQRVKAPTASLSAKSLSWWYYNSLTGSLSEEVPKSDDVAGAMLCEEMGLGKTLECIALMLLNPATDRDPTVTRWDSTTELDVSQVKTNLIVTPATLLQQWVDEIERHAPGLKILVYNGYSKVKLPKVPKAPKEEDKAGQSKLHRTWCSYFSDFDIMITTYNVLAAELGVAKAPVIRPKRQAASYSHVEKARSPLVMVEWARVFMDEVQLVGGGKTAEMVSLIPRAVSIAVSGTPAKSKVSDLSHVLKFLRVEPAIGSSRTWERLLKPEFKDLFTQLFRKYAVRTLKAQVKDELTIPSQRRFAVGIELGKVEKHIYDQTLQEALDDLGVDARGVAASDGWDLDISSLRTWLRKLRQICTHPQVGLGISNNNKNAAKALGTKTIKTIAEVLQGLQDQNWQSLVTDRKIKIQLCIRRSQLTQQVDEDVNRYQHSRDLLLSAQEEAAQLLKDIKVAIEEHEERGRQIKEEAAARRHERKQLDCDPELQVAFSKGKGKAREAESSDEDSDDTGLPHTQIGEEHRSRQRTLQGRLRETYVLQHKAAFLLGDVYHMLGSPEEEASYAAAELVRRTLLKSTEEAAISVMAKLTTDDLSESVQLKDLKLSHCQKGGIRSAHVMEEANDVLDLLNEQGDLLWQWRSRIFMLLTQKLSSSDGDQADGEEYARTLDTQGDVESYLQAYAALIADRKEVLVAERTALATHEARERKLRRTRAGRNAEENLMDLDDEPDGVEPEKVLEQVLADERKNLRDDHGPRALKAIMFQLSQIGNTAGNRQEETRISRDEGKRLRSIISDQGAVMEKLELELAVFRKVFNERIQYFRQLQELSDTVAEVEWEGDVREAIEATKAEEDKAKLAVNLKRARQRHLDNIAIDRAEGELEAEQDCILCRSLFQRGLMTPCAHLFCESCLTAWLKHKGNGRNSDCPVCRSRINIDTLQRISLSDEDFGKQLEQRGDTKVDRPVTPAHYIQFNSLAHSTLDEIATFEAYGSYGSKISHLVRHLLYLQAQEPGTKSVVFSAWSDSLTIIERALVDNGIGSVRVDQKGKQNAAQRFKTDPGILVFLLHGERENAGLNLTCAKRVWLIEPTVNHSFEVQAISRVDRMGQTAATEVFCYYIQDSVEENILRLGAKRGLSLYTKDHSRDAINISEFAIGGPKSQVDSPSKKEKRKGDFVEKAEDLIHVLFPHLDYREEDFADMTDVPHEEESLDFEGGNAVAGPSRIGSGHVNGVAGPSRLH